jgi:hypothetical protein
MHKSGKITMESFKICLKFAENVCETGYPKDHEKFVNDLKKVLKNSWPGSRFLTRSGIVQLTGNETVDQLNFKLDQIIGNINTFKQFEKEVLFLGISLEKFLYSPPIDFKSGGIELISNQEESNPRPQPQRLR